jgi:hypothetical protein
MKPKINPKLIAMMAACAIVANTAGISTARSQGMAAAAQQLVQTMRPMYVAQTAPEHAQTAAAFESQPVGDSAYGGTAGAGSAGVSAGGHRPTGCGSAPRCSLVFGQ